MIPASYEFSSALIISALLSLLLTFFFCWNLFKTLSQVKGENRVIQPFLIWLLLIPGLNLVLNFLVVRGMAKSLENELNDRDYEVEEKPGYTIGMAYAVMSCLVPIFSLVPITQGLLALAGVVKIIQLILFAQYWMKIYWFKNVLKNDLEEKEGDAK